MADDGASLEPSSSRRIPDTDTTADTVAAGRPQAPSLSTRNSSITAGPSVEHKRKVRTIPPYAALEPPTPPNESPPIHDTAGQVELEPPRHKRRRRLRHYWSSGESSCSSDAEDSSDEEPPWWTFTHKGMAKLRAGLDRPTKSTSPAAETPDAPGTEPESGRESLRSRDKRRRSVLTFKTPSRQDSSETTPPTSRRQSRLFHPRPFSVGTSSGLLRRSSDQGDALPTATGTAVVSKLDRTNSAPLEDHPALTGSPEREDAHSTPTRKQSPDHSGGDVTDPGPSAFRRQYGRRFMPIARRRDSHEPADALTDSETAMQSSPRLRAKQRLFTLGGLGNSVPEEDADTDEPGNSNTPNDAKNRLNANLRLRLPPPLTHHFSQGWPHAGSWQDALRSGTLDDGLGGPTPDRRKPRNLKIAIPPPPDVNELTAAAAANSPEAIKRRSVDFQPAIASPKRARRKSKHNRTRRPAMLPPTPGGRILTTPGAGERIIGSETWGENAAPAPDPNHNPFERVNPFDRIDEEYGLSPQLSRLSEKSSTDAKMRIFGRRRRSQTAPELSIWNRWKRRLFLDARVTIFIRVINLAISVTLLALAITIRLEIGRLHLRGIIGPSTTLIISYACLTIVHGLLAIYREYFGRPIGLWGLRSKMLWVCLDLLFIALWASAATLAINDYIDTPLDCTPSTPWWTSGQEFYTPTRSSRAATVAFVGKTGVQMAADTLVPDALKYSPEARAVCRRQIGCFVVSVVALLLYCGNMVLALFRIFETVRRTAMVGHRQSI